MDIVIDIYRSDINRLIEIFKNDFFIQKEAIVEALQHQGMFNIIHNETMFKVDFIIRKDIPYRELEFLRRTTKEFLGSKIWIATVEDLIISKLHWAKDSFSEMQIKDIRNLMLNTNLDYVYIDKWVKLLKLSDIYSKVKNG